MHQNILRITLFLSVLLIPSPVFAQQRWFETSSSMHKRVDWATVMAVIAYKAPYPVGARILTFTNGKVEEWGTIPHGSPSLDKLEALIKAQQVRWLQMQPHEQGSYLTKDRAVAYIDLSRIVSVAKVTPIEFGQEVYVLGFENSTGRGAVVEPSQKARIDKMISDSVIP